jgi:transcription initiation factor TFIIIB Brf1 subunit/transcription initiation factor TFIIB
MSERDLMQLAIESGVSLATARKWKKGIRVNQAIERALTLAAEKLGLEAGK